MGLWIRSDFASETAVWFLPYRRRPALESASLDSPSLLANIADDKSFLSVNATFRKILMHKSIMYGTHVMCVRALRLFLEELWVFKRWVGLDFCVYPLETRSYHVNIPHPFSHRSKIW